jgi:23S rRNA pseudouridine1911/1915/1917 synthase
LVPDDLGGAALDACVRQLFSLSWGRARDLVRRGKVAVDGQTSTDPVRKVRAGAQVVLDLAAPSPKTVRTRLPHKAIVHEDAHVVIVEKPPGISTVPFDPAGMGASLAKRTTHGEEPTLYEKIVQAVGNVGVVHRLDKETSGLVVFTKSWEAKKVLTAAFRRHDVERRYLALVHGVAKKQTIKSHLVPDRGDGVRGSVEKRRGRSHAVGSEKTQLAITHIDVEDRLPGARAGQPCTLIACRLETGRTHQIRIHLAESGHPLLGERVYTRGWPHPTVPAPRMMLHAAELGFVHPATNQPVRWTSPLPADMTEMLEFLRGS